MTKNGSKIPKFTKAGVPNPALPAAEYAAFFGTAGNGGAKPRWQDVDGKLLQATVDLAGKLGMLVCIGNGRDGHWLSVTIIHEGSKKSITADTAVLMNRHLSQALLGLKNLDSTEELEL